MTNKWDKLNEETHQICDKLIELKNDIDYFESTNNKEEMYIISQTETYPMTKTIKETWKEEIYEIITHNETSECHSKLVALVESLISQVEALVRRETVDEILEIPYIKAGGTWSKEEFINYKKTL